MSKLEEFSIERARILTPRADQLNKVSLLVREHVMGWLEEAKATTGEYITDILNNAVALAGHRQLASQLGLQIVLQNEDAMVHELPPLLPPFVEHEDDVEVGLPMSPQNTSWVQWMGEQRQMSRETIVHDGIRILGLMASIPGSQLAIPEFRSDAIIPVRPGVDLASAPLFVDKPYT